MPTAGADDAVVQLAGTVQAQRPGAGFGFERVETRTPNVNAAHVPEDLECPRQPGRAEEATCPYQRYTLNLNSTTSPSAIT